MSSHTPPVILWIRQDLRTTDNAALSYAASVNKPVVAAYIDDTVTECKTDEQGSAMRLWMHHALKDFQKILASCQIPLWVYQGDPQTILQDIITQTGAEDVVWNRLYTPSATMRDAQIKQALKSQNKNVKSFAGAYLFEPHQVMNKQGDVYKVYTPFRKACETMGIPHEVIPAHAPLQDNPFLHYVPQNALPIETVFPLPTAPDWGSQMVSHWDISGQGAINFLERFIEHFIEDYKTARDFPARQAVSKLSPYLARGMISPRMITSRLQMVMESAGKTHFISELLWREFATYLLFHFPYMQKSNFRPEWDDFVWDNDESFLKAWQKGQTGYPLIDAAMQELWQTGYMHNRTRMLVGSFLVKHLLIDWRYGEKWFRNCLFDFDVANNIASWQWVAGSGADAAPYFRIFNPCLQSEKFDGNGEYIKKYLPVLKNVPASLLPEFHTASSAELMMAGIVLGGNYPAPIVSLALGKEKAIARYEQLKQKKQDS